MAIKKERVSIPPVVAARVLFAHDRTCCVCRQRKPVQIHHVDDDPSNNEEVNLAVLCLDCHRDTQISGGFDRKLDAEQVRLYRAAWLDHIRERRAFTADFDRPSNPELSSTMRLQTLAAQIEVARDREDWLELAFIYHGVGDTELRDKYADKVLAGDPPAWQEVLLRVRQGKTDLLSQDAIDEVLDTDDWTTKARILTSLGRTKEAAAVYLEGITEAIKEERYFLAAIYMKSGLGDLINPLFEMALAESIAEGDLWWQLRAYDELGWLDAKRELLLGSESEIRESGFLPMMRELAAAKGDEVLMLQVVKAMAEIGPLAGVIRIEEANEGEVESEGQADPPGPLRRSTHVQLLRPASRASP
jgi:hypothetical protein